MKKIMFVLIAVCSLVVVSNSAFAHSGRTDSFGGHTNSSTGLYEFHGF